MKMLNYLLLLVCLGTVYSDGGKQPNFIVILTDDQDEVLGGMVSNVGMLWVYFKINKIE